MSDVTSSAPRTRRRRQGSVPRSTGWIDAFWRTFGDRLDAATQAVAPTMGSVTGFDGHKPLVLIDDEDQPRTVGFPKAKGVRYSVGDRVKVSKTRGGDWTVDGLVSASSNEQAVGNEQLYDNSVDGRALADGSVTANHLSSGVSGTLSGLRSDLGNPPSGTTAYGAAVAADRHAQDVYNVLSPYIGDLLSRMCKVETKLGLAKGRCNL